MVFYMSIPIFLQYVRPVFNSIKKTCVVNFLHVFDFFLSSTYISMLMTLNVLSFN